ncbi:helix-turn-helix transcriptional regulator, partial [Acinetobacter sp. 12966]
KLYNGQSTRIDFETIEKLCLLLNVEVGELLKLQADED